MQQFTFLKTFILVLFLAGTTSIHAQSFACNSDLYQVVNGKDLKKLNPSTGQYLTIGSSSISYNGAAFNYEDGYIYGIGSGTKLVRIASDGSSTDLGSISGFTALTYSGDMDTLGNWYSFRQVSGAWLMNQIDVSSSPAVAQEYSVTELSGATNASNCADISFNSLTGKFYGMSGGKLVEFDPTNRTVKGIADYSSTAESGGYGAVWSDVEGHSYFFNNNTGNIYKATFDASGNVLSFVFVSTSSPNGNNDGMNCTLGAPPVFPEVCNNGVDDDGDGLVDCDDPDCTATETCGVSSVVINTDFACEGSIATYHLFFTNNSASANAVDAEAVIPAGFIFLQDTIEFDVTTSATINTRPVAGAMDTLRWGQIPLEGGETVRISYDVSVDGTAANGTHGTTVDASLNTAGTLFYPEDTVSNITIGACPTPNEYNCEPAFYQVYRKRGKKQPNVYGKLDPITGDYDPIAVASDYANGLGYDINTGLVYGAAGKTFVQLDEDGLTKAMGITFTKNVYRGDIDESSQWYGVDGNNMVVIDVSGTPVVTATHTNQGLPGWDMAYNKDGNFYSIHGQTLYRFNTTSNIKETVGSISGLNLPTSGGYGAQWTGSDGYLYASHNSSGKILRVDVSTGGARVVSYSVDGLSKNDGFSCPTEIPVVYEFDYGDNSRLPQSRVLSYRMDVSNDGVPDFSTVWLGSTVDYDTSNPANENADGDTDDGMSMDTELNNGTVMSTLGLNANYTGTAYGLIGLDWDDDGLFDEVITDTYNLTGAQTVFKNFIAPGGFESGHVNVRVLISEDSLAEANISGDIVAMGEVEDYRFYITTPCEGEGCGVPTGNEGGLESNGSLAEAIAKRNYSRTKSSYQGGIKTNQQSIGAYRAVKSAARSAAASALHLYLPETGVFGTEEVNVSSPLDLIQLSNAKEVFAVDYYAKEQRVAAGLLLKTEKSVYNHSKNVCDRLNGKEVEEVQLMKIDGVSVLIAKITIENGAREYSGWFSAKNADDGYHVFSYWNIDAYPEGDYLNFQAWSSSISQVMFILKHAMDKLRNEKAVISDTNIKKIPSVYVKKGAYSMGAIHLEVLNPKGVTTAILNLSSRATEFDDFVETSHSLTFSGAPVEEISLPIGHFFDAGLSLYALKEQGYDALYLADGAWGLDYNNAKSAVESFEIFPELRGDVPGNYLIERGFAVQGKCSDVVNIFRNLKAGNGTLDISSFETLGFNLTSNQSIEVSLVPDNLQSWEYRPKMSLEPNPNGRRIILQLEDFAGLDPSVHELKSIVFSYINDQDEAISFDLKVEDLTLGSESDILTNEAPFKSKSVVVYPNPTHGDATVALTLANKGAYAFDLVSMEGKVVLSHTGEGQGQVNLTLAAQEYRPGLYFLNVYANNKKTVTKLIIR